MERTDASGLGGSCIQHTETYMHLSLAFLCVIHVIYHVCNIYKCLVCLGCFLSFLILLVCYAHVFLCISGALLTNLSARQFNSVSLDYACTCIYVYIVLCVDKSKALSISLRGGTRYTARHVITVIVLAFLTQETRLVRCEVQ